MAHPVYLTYEDYVSTYLGTLSESDFVLAEFKARKRIDYLTSSRVQDMERVPEAVRLCIVSLIAIDSASGAVAQAVSPTATSFNTDGYSETYGNALSVEDAESAMDKLVCSCLYGELDDDGIPLLYRGVRRR